jgi:hypothetical protein
VDKWVNQSSAEWSGTIALTANQKYPIMMEYFENTGNAVAKLSWSSTNQFKQIIPMSQLYPTTGTIQPVLTTGVSQGTNLVLNWSGTYALESASQVTGPWTPITTNAGPLTINMTLAPQMFYRLLIQ